MSPYIVVHAAACQIQPAVHLHSTSTYLPPAFPRTREGSSPPQAASPGAYLSPAPASIHPQTGSRNADPHGNAPVRLAPGLVTQAYWQSTTPSLQLHRRAAPSVLHSLPDASPDIRSPARACAAGCSETSPPTGSHPSPASTDFEPHHASPES